MVQVLLDLQWRHQWYQFPVGELGKTPVLMQLQNETSASAFLSDGGATAASHCESHCSLEG